MNKFFSIYYYWTITLIIRFINVNKQPLINALIKKQAKKYIWNIKQPFFYIANQTDRTTSTCTPLFTVETNNEQPKDFNTGR